MANVVSYEQLLFNAIKNGQTGKSVYDIWLELGNTGTPQDFLDSLKTPSIIGTTTILATSCILVDGIYKVIIPDENVTVDGEIGTKSKKALAIAFQVELNKLGANLGVDGYIGSGSASKFDKLVGGLKSGLKDNIFVTLWQCVLVAYNFNPLGIDGDFGMGCKSATNKLLKKIGRSEDSNVTGADLNAVL